MKVNIENNKNTVEVKDAQYGHIYLYMDKYIMCFQPCRVHESSAKTGFSLKNEKHFIRINENDTMSLILDGSESLEYVGEAVISIA